MKKFLSLLLTIALIAQMLVVPVFAEEGASAALSSENLSGKPGETVCLTLSLEGADNTSAIGVEIYSELVLDQDASQWLLENGILADFDSETSGAVWTTEAEEGADVNGDIATLAFTIPSVAAQQESVSCIVKLYDQEGNLLDTPDAEIVVDVIHIPAESVTVSEDTLTLDLAGTSTAALGAVILPEDTTDVLSWSSDNENVAVVDENGNVTALGVGAANITASTVSSLAGGESISASCAVTVTCSHSFENYCCTLCGYSEPSEDCVASVASPYGGNFYFTSLKAAVDFAHTIPREVRPFVAVEQDCTIDETITISDGINIFSSVEGENRNITVTADTAFELTDRAFLLINYLDIQTTGSYIFKLTANGNGVQMSDTNLSGATNSAFYVPEGVERNGIQFYGGSISAYTAITMNGNQGGFTIAGGEVPISVSNPDGAFILNGSNYSGEVFGANVTNSAENGVCFSLSNTSNISFPGGVLFNGVNNYWNPHYNQPDGKIVPNHGAAARVDATYYGNMYPAFEAASQILYKNEDGSVIEEASVPVTIIGDLNTAEHLTLDARYPIDLYATGNSPQILLENGAVLNINQTTRLHNATIYVCNGAAINGLNNIDLSDGGKIVYESDFDAIETNVAKVVRFDGTYQYFTSLKEAVEFVHDTPIDERSAVFVLRDCTIDETITISKRINIFPSVFGEPRNITVTADTAFDIKRGPVTEDEDAAYLLINDLNFDTTGNYIFNLTEDYAGVQMSNTNLSGATDSAFYAAEGVDGANIQFYGGSISGYTAIELNGSNGSIGMAGGSIAITVSNPAGAFVMNGDFCHGEVFGANVTNSAEYSAVFSLSNTSNISFPGGVTLNGVNNYWNPNYNQPSGQIIPNYGAAARVDATYFGNMYPAFEAASEILYTNEDGSVAEDASVPITIIGDPYTAEKFPTLTANHPIELYIAGRQNRLVLESGGILNIAQETRLHNATIYVKNGAELSGEENLNLEDNGHLIRESDMDANEAYVAKVLYQDGTYRYFESLNEAIDFAMTAPVEGRPPVHILRDCELTETVTLDSDLHIVPNYPSGDPAAPDVVAHTIYAGEGVDTMFNIGGDCFFIVDFTYFDAQGADYAFNITSADATLLLSGGNTTGAAKAAIHTTEDVHYEAVLQGENANDPFAWSANIQLYGCEISGDTAIILNGSGTNVLMAGMNGCVLEGTGTNGAIVFNGDDHVVCGYMANLYAEDIAFTVNGNSTYMGGNYNGYFYNPGAESTTMPCVGVAARMDLCYYGDLQDAFDVVSSAADEIDDPNFALQVEILSDITVTDELILEDALYPVHLIMNGHTITVANGGTFDVRDDMVALVNGTIYVANGGVFAGYVNTDHNSQIEYEEETIGTVTSGNWTMSLDQVIYLNYYPTLTGWSEGYDFAGRGGVVVWTGSSNPTSRYDIEVGKPNTVTIHGMHQNADGKWYVQTDDIFAQNLGDRVYIRPYVMTVDGEYIYQNGAPYYSPALYCYDILNNLESDENTRNVCAALLEYGAEAQKYFGNDSNLVTTIPSGYPNIDLSSYTQTLTYKDSYLDPITLTDHVRSIAGTLTGNRSGITLGVPTLALEGAIRLSERITINGSVINADNIQKVEMLFWTADQIANLDTLAYENLNSSNTWFCQMEDLGNGTYSAKSDFILAKNMGQMIYYSCRITMNDGSVYRSGLGYYNVEGFISDTLADSNSRAAEVCRRLAVYGEMARIRFA